LFGVYEQFVRTASLLSTPGTRHTWSRTSHLESDIMATHSTKTRIAIVTGGSRGLGRSMLEHLGSQGFDAILTYREQEEKAHAVVRELEAAGRKAVALRLDVAEASSFAAFADTVRDTLARTWDRKDFDVLVNNAGHGDHALHAESTEAQFDDLSRVHLKAPFFLTQRLAPMLADGGRIVNVSTGLARFTLPGYAAYATMKGGVEVLTRYLAKELGGRGITVNTIAPGAIETDFGGGVVRDDPGVNAYVASQTALGRVGLPDDVGGALALLVSPEARWITGQRIEVSGGQSI
jgi:NAD(P)-dependent dehydrogenase (short-subunit alcohol dehydrogenase family)